MEQTFGVFWLQKNCDGCDVFFEFLNIIGVTRQACNIEQAYRLFRSFMAFRNFVPMQIRRRVPKN